VSTPNDPDQPQQPQRPPTGEQPAYPSQPYPGQPYPDQPYGYQQQPPPHGYQQYASPYGGYPQYGGYPGQPPTGPPRRPGTLIAAGALWLLLAVPTLLFGIGSLLADRIPDIDQLYANNPDLTPEFVRNFGIGATSAGLALLAFGIAVFSGALWARIAAAVVGGLIGLFGFVFVVPLVLAIVAIVLQFLPASNAYDKARRERTV
jgi:hypothetical protein